MRLTVDIEKELPGFHLQVAFQCEQETFGLLGSSGSGKSMTLRCIAGLETPTRGYISLGDKVLFDSAGKINLPPQGRRVGFLFQNYALFPHMTAAENIRVGLLHLCRTGQKQRLTELSELLQLHGLLERHTWQLSGGQQQRVALARALAIQPAALLLDEPFSALDNHLRSELEQQVSALLSLYNIPSILVSHNLDEAFRLCPNMLILSKGQCVDVGSRESIFARPSTYEAARVTACQNISRARKLGEYEIEAIDWNCKLTVRQPVPDHLTHAGIRAHHILPVAGWSENSFSYYIKDTVHSPDYNIHTIQIAALPNTGYSDCLKVKLGANVSLPQQNLSGLIKLPAEHILLLRKLA